MLCAGCAWLPNELLGEVTLPAEQRHEFRYTVPEQGTLGFYLKSASPEKMVSRADDAAEAECSIRNPLTDLSGKSITLESDSAGGVQYHGAGAIIESMVTSDGGGFAGRWSTYMP
jgi:hypothetical protein